MKRCTDENRFPVSTDLRPFTLMVCLVLIAFALVWIPALSGCGGSQANQTVQVHLKHFSITAADTVIMTVVCNDQIAYVMKLLPGEPVEIGGPEALCHFNFGEPVDVDVEPVWDKVVRGE